MKNNDTQQNNGLAEKVEDLRFKSDKGNFSTIQVFNKNIQVNGIIRMKNFTTAPASASVGDLVVVGGVLKICTVGGSSPTWTKVGSQ